MHKKKVFFNVTLHYIAIKKKRERLRGNKKRYLLGTERRKKKNGVVECNGNIDSCQSTYSGYLIH